MGVFQSIDLGVANDYRTFQSLPRKIPIEGGFSAHVQILNAHSNSNVERSDRVCAVGSNRAEPINQSHASVRTRYHTAILDWPLLFHFNTSPASHVLEKEKGGVDLFMPDSNTQVRCAIGYSLLRYVDFSRFFSHLRT